MAERAEASERLSAQIVEGLTSGLVVVDRGGTVRSVNPAAKRILALADAPMGTPFRQLLARAPELADVIGEVSRQIGSLRRQAAKAMRYKRLNHRLHHLALGWSGFHHSQLTATLAERLAKGISLRIAFRRRSP